MLTLLLLTDGSVLLTWAAVLYAISKRARQLSASLFTQSYAWRMLSSCTAWLYNHCWRALDCCRPAQHMPLNSSLLQQQTQTVPCMIWLSATLHVSMNVSLYLICKVGVAVNAGLQTALQDLVVFIGMP